MNQSKEVPKLMDAGRTWLCMVLGCALLVFAWARRRHGEIAALGAAALVAFEPNLMAHAGLVTTDLPCTFFVLLACFTWMRMLEEPTMKRSLVGTCMWLTISKIGELMCCGCCNCPGASIAATKCL